MSCLPGECPCFLALCHWWKYACVVDLALQECSKVTLDDVEVLGECCPSCYDFYLNIIVLVIVSGAVSLSQVDVAFNVLDLSVIDIGCISYMRVSSRSEDD